MLTYEQREVVSTIDYYIGCCEWGFCPRVSRDFLVKMRAALASSTEQLPVAEVVIEQNYWSRGHFYEGTRHVLRTLADINNLAVGTKLYAAKGTDHAD